MPRLLLITTIPGMLSAFLLPLARHFRALGWRVDGAASSLSEDPDLLLEFDQVWDVPWSRDPLAPGNLRALGSIASVIERGGHDIVHVHAPVSAFISRLAARLVRSRARVVYTAHGFHFHPQGARLANAAYFGLEWLAGWWTDRLVVMNEHDLRAARRLLPRERIEWMPGVGIDLDSYSRAAISSRDEAELRAQLDVPSDAPVFLMVAEFIPRKRHVDLIEAFARMRHAEARLVLVGEGRLFQLVRELSQRSLGSRCALLGFRRDVPRLSSVATALVLPSIQEGLPRCVMEAMAMRVPVIGCDVRGTADLLRDGAGILVPPRDPGALARALDGLIDDPQSGRRAVEMAARRIREYELSGVLARHQRLYETVLSMPRRRDRVPHRASAEPRSRG